MPFDRLLMPDQPQGPTPSRFTFRKKDGLLHPLWGANDRLGQGALQRRTISLGRPPVSLETEDLLPRSAPATRHRPLRPPSEVILRLQGMPHHEPAPALARRLRMNLKALELQGQQLSATLTMIEDFRREPPWPDPETPHTPTFLEFQRTKYERLLAKVTLQRIAKQWELIKVLDQSLHRGTTFEGTFREHPSMLRRRAVGLRDQHHLLGIRQRNAREHLECIQTRLSRSHASSREDQPMIEAIQATRTHLARERHMNLLHQQEILDKLILVLSRQDADLSLASSVSPSMV